jgi:hypothetical protein
MGREKVCFFPCVVRSPSVLAVRLMKKPLEHFEVLPSKISFACFTKSRLQYTRVSGLYLKAAYNHFNFPGQLPSQAFTSLAFFFPDFFLGRYG